MAFSQSVERHNDDCTVEECRALVQRIEGSSTFQKSPRLREFLLFVCDRHLEGDRDSLREQSIGQAVFRKPAGYDPVADNVVRVQARQLRLKLQQYFAHERPDEPLILEIPKGSYVPVFRHRTAELLVPVITPEEIQMAPVAIVDNRWKWVAATLAVALAISLALLAWQNIPRSNPSGNASTLQWPLTEVFDDHRRTLIVVSDGTSSWVSVLAGKQVHLDSYTRMGYPDALLLPGSSPDLAGLMSLSGRLRVTSAADLAIVANLAHTAGSRFNQSRIWLARDVRLRDIQENNLILIGTSASNPWASLFEQKLNFQSEFELEGHYPLFRNQKPAAGEQATYRTYALTGNPGTAFGLVALMKHPDHEGNVMLIQGATMEATEAVGRVLVDSVGVTNIRQRLGAGLESQPRLHFEMLFRTMALAGRATNAEIIATRALR